MNPDSCQKHSPMWLQSLIALGVVFGDIGTSPLYALRECFSHHSEIALNSANILGILSLILWTLIIVICLKYITFILRADNEGEGGILSLMSLVTKNKDGPMLVTTLGLVGAAFLFGDGIITPAISVLSAVEGLQIVAPDLDQFVLPLTIFFLFLLFYFQKFGTAKIGSFFGPIILVWFLVIGTLGLFSIFNVPAVLWAINPYYAIQFFMENSLSGLLVLGSVFLVVTGGEALYADMGHCGRAPIQRAWFFVALPALVLNYFGQGALLLQNPDAIQNPFYLLAPKWFLWPLVGVSTLATIIASQALISGVYSLTKQAMQLGYFPRMQIVHTSSDEIGQIYLPFMNYALLTGVIWLVIEFKSSSDLASAYGVAVTATMAITTYLAYHVAIERWKWSRFAAISLFGTFFIIDLLFFATNIIKFWTGGWVAILAGVLVYFIMITWRMGRKELLESLKSRSISEEDFLKKLEMIQPHRVSGNAIYMSGDAWGIPIPLLHNLKHNKVLHENIMILTVKTQPSPTVSANERLKVKEVAPNIYKVRAYFGFMERPNIYLILKWCKERDLHFVLEHTTFVMGRETLITEDKTLFATVRKKLFAFMSRNAERPMNFFGIPPNQVIEVGVQIKI